MRLSYRSVYFYIFTGVEDLRLGGTLSYTLPPDALD